MSFMQCGNAVHFYRLHSSPGLRTGSGQRSSPPLRAGTSRSADPGASLAPVLPAGAPVIVFINGLGTDHRIWDGVLAALPADLSALVYDLRGQGLTEWTEGRWDVAGLSADLARLLDGLGIGPVVLCGLSLGGLVAQSFALSHPERVRALCLCATAACIGTPELWRARAEQVQKGGVAAVAAQVIERWFSPTFLERQPSAARGWRVLLERAPAAGYLAALQLLGQTDLRASIGRISAPTLVLAGAADVATPPDQVRLLAEAIPHAEFLMLPGAGHLLCIEEPGSLVRALDEFLGGKGIV
jgi:3-oxoadipate enol-lactonase